MNLRDNFSRGKSFFVEYYGLLFIFNFSGKGEEVFEKLRVFFKHFGVKQNRISARNKKVFAISVKSRTDFWKAIKKFIDCIISSFEEDFAIFHASCVCSRNFSFVFLGKSGYGKSTSAKLMCDAGFDFITEDTLFLGRCGIIPFPKPIVLKSKRTWNIFLPERVPKRPPKNIVFFFLKRKPENYLDFKMKIKSIAENLKDVKNFEELESKVIELGFIRKIPKYKGVEMLLRSIYNAKKIELSWVINKLSSALFLEI